MVTRQALPQQTIQTQLNTSLNTLNLNRLRLRITRVPRDVAIAPDRFFLTLDYNGDCWSYPIQLTQQEISQLIEQAQGLTLLGGMV